MATLKSNDNNEMIVTCDCGCDEGIRVRIDKSFECYCYLTYVSGNFYKDQLGLLDKLKKIWKIIRNKDFCYSDIVMSKEDFIEYRNWLNSMDADVEGDLISRKSVLELSEYDKNNNLVILYDKVKELPTICNMDSIERYLSGLNNFKIEVNKMENEYLSVDNFLHFIDRVLKRIKKEFINLRCENEK